MRQALQYVTFMDDHMLQRDDGSVAVVTFPEGSMAGAVEVPIPGSDRHLQYVPLLNSRVVTAEEMAMAAGGRAPHVPSHAAAAAAAADTQQLCSPSQTEKMVADAAKQHAQLVSGVEEGRKSAEGTTKKPQLRQVDSGELLDSMAMERSVSHKRERSVTLRELPNLELDTIPSAKVLGVSEFYAATDASGGGGGTAAATGVVPASAISAAVQARTMNTNKNNNNASNASNASTPTTAGEFSPDDTKKTITAYVKPIKLFSDGLDDLLDDGIRRILSTTLETPPGTKRRGRPPGRSKNTQEILPDGWVEPTDAEILANLLLENPHLKTLSADELKKHIRKEKNKISAAMSRVRLRNEQDELEGQVRKLEEEHSTLSEWLSTGSGAHVVRRQSGEGGADGGVPAPAEKMTLVRHFSL